ncbi:MAG: lysine N(6)-hydroxylase/L-ornithine N(5)-oxygenase family protein [Chitinophagaceae bacterium]
MEAPPIFDLMGIGLGPFNLGLAALCQPLKGLKSIFLEQGAEFNWHPGMMLETSTLQVPFFADLVTLANPSSPHSFLAYLKAQGRLFQFAIRENNYLTRREFNRYCQWVVSRLSGLYFHHRVHATEFDPAKNCYRIRVHLLPGGQEKIFYSRHLVLGTGTQPNLPDFARKWQSPDLIHSSDYLHFKDRILGKKKVIIIGSGQSAAEIYFDLLGKLEHFPQGLFWYTRSDRFFPMENAKLTYEMTSPDYQDYFFHLPEGRKLEILANQDMLYKGINASLINDIYDLLYLKTIEGQPIPTGLFPGWALRDIDRKADGHFILSLHHTEQQRFFQLDAEAVILATGYQAGHPSFLEPIRDRIRWNSRGQLAVDQNYSIDLGGKEIFVQNAELHTHGFSAPDLGMGPYRNATILQQILGYAPYPMEKRIAFQTFGGGEPSAITVQESSLFSDPHLVSSSISRGKGEN